MAGEAVCSHLRGDLVLVEVGEVLEFGEDILCSWKCLWLTPLPLLSFLSSCVCGTEGKKKSERKQQLRTGQWYRSPVR